MIDGSARQLLYLLGHLNRHQFPPLVLLDVPGPMTDAVRALEVAVEVTPMRPWRSLRGWPFRGGDARRITALARAHGAAIVHCSDTWRTPYAARAARCLEVPMIAHVRGPASPRDLAKNHCLDADAMLAIAQRYADDIVAAGYPAARTRVVNDAVDADRYQPDPAGGSAFRAEHDVGRPLVVGLVGRVEPFKRVVEFIELVAAIPADVDATYVLIGAIAREPYVDEVERRIAQLGIGERVRFAGRRDDMPAVLSGLDVLATMSGGSVMFEAQACGVPVFSVRTDGRHSQHTRHGETGWCITTDRPDRAAAALVELLRDADLRARLATSGRRYVLDHLAPHVMARQTEAAYAAVLAGRSMLLT